VEGRTFNIMALRNEKGPRCRGENDAGSRKGKFPPSKSLRSEHGLPPLNLDWVEYYSRNTSCGGARASSLGTRRTVKKEWQRRVCCEPSSCMT